MHFLSYYTNSLNDASKSETSSETLIYGIFPDTILRDSVFANGDTDAQWTIYIPKTYSKPILC